MLDPKDNTYFEFFDVTRKVMVIEDADYSIMIGSSSDNIKSSFNIHIDGEKIFHRNVMHTVEAIDYNPTYGTEINYSKEISKHYVYCNSWSGAVIFKDCLMSEATSIQIVATSVLTNGKITIKSNGKELCTMDIPASDGFYDFKEFTSTFSEKLNCIQDLEISFNQGVGILSIQVFS